MPNLNHIAHSSLWSPRPWVWVLSDSATTTITLCTALYRYLITESLLIEPCMTDILSIRQAFLHFIVSRRYSLKQDPWSTAGFWQQISSWSPQAPAVYLICSGYFSWIHILGNMATSISIHGNSRHSRSCQQSGHCAAKHIDSFYYADRSR